MNRLRPASRVLRQYGTVLALLLLPVVVLAHAYLERSSPKAGEKLAAPPKQVVLIFSKPVELAVTSIQLWTVDSVSIPVSAPRAHPAEPAGIVVDVPALTPREYRVRWRTTSADGHPIQGSFRFTVLSPPGADAAAARVEEAVHDEETMDSTEHVMMHDDDPDAVREGLGGVSIPRTIARWLSFLALFAATGAAAFLWLVLPKLRTSALVEPAATAAIDQGIRLTGTVAAFAIAALVLPQLWSASADVVDTGSSAIMTYATNTAAGRALLAQLVGAVIAAIGFTTLPRSRRTGEVLALVGAVTAIVATSYGGHPAAAGSPVLITLLTIVHVLASSIWFGMLLIVAAVAIPRMLRSSTVRPVPAIAAVINIFSPIALVCGGAAVSVGVILAFLHVGSFAALVRSDYGRTLMVKVVLVLLVFGTGFFNWKRMKPALGDPAGGDRLARSATAELVIAALVLAATAILVALPSPASLAP